MKKISGPDTAGRSKKAGRNAIIGWLFILPCTLVLILMAVYPLLQILHFSVSDVKLLTYETSFVGLENFKRVFSNPQLPPILAQTLIWIIVSLSLRIILGFAAALMMDSGLRFKSVFRVTTLIPWVVPSIVAAMTWRFVYNPDIGLINTMIRSNFNPEFSLVWIKEYPLASVIVTFVWTGFPFIMLMVMAGLQAIPNDYKEAARIDGANAGQVFIHIILPNLKNILIIITILELITGFNAFDLIYMMTGGGPGIRSTILGIMIYNLGFISRDFGRSSAASVILLSLVLLIFLIYAPMQAVGGRRKGKKGEL